MLLLPADLLQLVTGLVEAACCSYLAAARYWLPRFRVLIFFFFFYTLLLLLAQDLAKVSLDLLLLLPAAR